MASYNWNWPAIVTNSGPIQFLLDGVVTTVSEDTGTPANSTPLPVIGLNPSGNPQDTNYGVVGAETLRTAAQIGNATGPADFDAGATGAQTLRVEANQGAPGVGAWPVLAAQAGTWTVQPGNTPNTAPWLVTVATSLPAGAAIIGKVGIDQTTPGTTNGVQVVAALPAGANVIGHVITDTGSVVAVSNFPATQPVSGTVTANQGTPGTAANAWFAKITDGTNTTAVKAASTAAIATDPSAVVALSPNSPLPTGSNTIGALTANQSVNVAQINGVAPLMGAGNTGTGSQRVTIASDQVAIATKAPVNSNGNYVQGSLTTTAASANTAPANAVGFILESESGNANNIRWCIGATASTTNGVLMEPGRDTGYVPCAATVSICNTVSSTQAFNLQWVLSV